MALEIEDGTGKANATSYNTLVELRAYAVARGVTLPVDDSAVEVMATKAIDYLESKRASYQGTKTFPGVQALQFPRTGVTVDCDYELPSEGAGSIPSILKAAQAQAVLEVQAGLDLMPSSNGQIVKRTKVDVIEKEFAVGTESGTSGVPMPVFPKVDALLAPLFSACGGGFALTTVRI